MRTSLTIIRTVLDIAGSVFVMGGICVGVMGSYDAEGWDEVGLGAEQDIVWYCGVFVIVGMVALTLFIVLFPSVTSPLRIGRWHARIPRTLRVALVGAGLIVCLAFIESWCSSHLVKVLIDNARREDVVKRAQQQMPPVKLYLYSYSPSGLGEIYFNLKDEERIRAWLDSCQYKYRVYHNVNVG